MLSYLRSCVVFFIAVCTALPALATQKPWVAPNYVTYDFPSGDPKAAKAEKAFFEPDGIEIDPIDFSVRFSVVKTDEFATHALAGAEFWLEGKTFQVPSACLKGLSWPFVSIYGQSWNKDAVLSIHAMALPSQSEEVKVSIVVRSIPSATKDNVECRRRSLR